MLELLKNRPFLAQLIGLAFALALWLGVRLPTTFTQESVIATAMLVIAAVTIFLRHLHVGSPEADGKPWWQSRTIWTQVIAAGFAVLALFGFVPEIGEGEVLNVAMMVATLAGLVFGAKAKSAIG